MTISIFARDPDKEIIDEVSDFISLTAVARLSDVGSIALEVPFGETALALAEPGAGILIEQDGVPLISGVVDKPDRSFSESNDGYVISFVTDEALLNDTLVYPCAPVGLSNNRYKFAVAEYDVRVGNAETIMHQYVLANAGPTNPLYPWTRPIPGLTFAPNLGRGPSVTGRARMVPLLELLQEIASISNLGFRISNFQFGVVSPANLASEIAFSTEIGNLLDYKYSVSRPTATHLAIGGGGSGTDRLFYLKGDNAAATKWGWRIEKFVDQRSTTDLAELVQKYDEEIANSGEKTTFSITPLDIDGYAFGVDYKLGDIVTGEADGVEITGSIGQVTVSLNADGLLVRPEFNTATTSQAAYMLKTFDILRKQQRRISALERNL